MKSRKTYIEKLIEQGEHQTQDFKFEVSDSKKIARTLSAFSNTEGGKLLIGVKDNGVPAGIRSDEEIHMLEAAAQMYCKPEVPLKFTEWVVQGKKILEVEVAKNLNYLVSAPDKNGEYKVFIRLMDQNILANGMYIKAWEEKKKNRKVKIEYTQTEKEFLQYIDRNPSSSWSTLRKQLNLSSNKLTKLILDFLLIEVIDLIITEKGYFYSLNNNETEKNEHAKKWLWEKG